jgi:hypothetical protein
MRPKRITGTPVTVMTEALLNKLIETQCYLQSEWAMNEVESAFRKREQAALHPSYRESLFLQKKHYILCYLALKYRESLSQELSPFFQHIWTDRSKFLESKVVYPSMVTIQTKVQSGFDRVCISIR